MTLADSEFPLVDDIETPDTRTRQEKEEDWLYFALCIAKGCRLRMQREETDLTALAISRFERESALKSAVAHAHNLRVEGYGLPGLLIMMMQSEGIL